MGSLNLGAPGNNEVRAEFIRHKADEACPELGYLNADDANLSLPFCNENWMTHSGNSS